MKNIPKIINHLMIGLTYDIKRTFITKAKNMLPLRNYKKDFNLDINNNDYIKINISLI